MSSSSVRGAKQEHLALAIASGQSASEWAKANGVNDRTARSWAALEGVQALARAFRGRMVDEALGRLSANVGRAVDQIARLATGASNEAVRLSAARAILAELLNFRSHVEVINRLDEIETRLNRAGK